MDGRLDEELLRIIERLWVRRSLEARHRDRQPAAQSLAVT